MSVRAADSSYLCIKFFLTVKTFIFHKCSLYYKTSILYVYTLLVKEDKNTFIYIFIIILVSLQKYVTTCSSVRGMSFIKIL